MPSTYTSSLRLTLPATGELSGSWGNTVNTGITTLTDNAIAGYTTVTMTDADYTLTTANGATDEARSMMLNITGTLTAARNVICPTASKLYIIKNATTGGFAITLKTSGGTGISIPNGKSMLLMCDGTNVVDAVTQFSAGAFTTISYSGNLTATGTAQRITGDYSNATVANRLLFQTSTTNATTNIGVIPSGTGTTAQFNAFNNSDPTNASQVTLGVTSSEARVTSTITGTGTFLPLTFYTNAAERMRIDTSGNVGIGTATPGYKLDVSGTVASTNFFSTGNLNLGNAKFIAFSASTPSTSNYAVYGDTTQTVLNAPSAGVLKFNNNNVEQMRLDSSGRVGIGTAPSNQTLAVATNITGNVNSYGIRQFGTIQSDVTTFSAGVSNVLLTAASAFTLTNYNHYFASQGTLGAGSAVTAQYGYHADSSLTGATNNYGFFSNIASGTGRFNFYAAGTADNYFAGKLGLGTVNLAGYTFRVGGSLTGATTYIASDASGVIQPDVTASVIQIRSNPSTASNGGTGYTIGAIRHFQAVQSSYSADSTITTQYGFIAESNLTSATNNYGFVSAIPSGTNRFNFYASGTADNYFAGNVGLGGLPNAYQKLGINGAYSESGGASEAVSARGGFNSATLVNAFTYISRPTIGTGVAATNLYHFQASPNTFTGTVTNQYGFFAASNLTGATNNYGFVSDIASGTGRWNFYASGTADNYFAGNLGIGNTNPAAKLDVVGNQANFTRYSTDATPFYTVVAKYRGTAGTPVTVNNNDNIGQQQFYAYDGTAIRNSAVISAEVDGVPATSTVPGRLTFFTTPAGASQTPLERMRLDSSGNVGIGDTSPATRGRLSVVATTGVGRQFVVTTAGLTQARYDDNSLPNAITIQNYGLTAAGQGSGLLWSLGDSVANANDAGQIRVVSEGIWGATAGSRSSYMQFSTTAAGNLGERMRLDSSGNLGIGTNAPGYKLDVRGTNNVIQSKGTSGYGSFYANAATGSAAFYFFGVNDVETARISSASTNYIAFSTNDTTISEKVRITQAGDVGIGTVSPGAKLDVSGGSSRATGAGGSYAQLNGGDANGAYLQLNRAGSGTQNAYLSQFQGNLLLKNLDSGNILFTNTTSDTERMRITSAGNQIAYQPAESAQNTSVTLSVANLQARIITSNAAVTLTLPTGTTLESYTGNMTVDTAFEVTFIATTANAITIGANGNTTVGSLTVSGNTSGTFRFRKTAANTFTVYRVY